MNVREGVGVGAGRGEATSEQRREENVTRCVPDAVAVIQIATNGFA